MEIEAPTFKKQHVFMVRLFVRGMSRAGQAHQRFKMYARNKVRTILEHTQNFMQVGKEITQKVLF